LILDLLEWIGPESRPYSEVMAAWRTSCPGLQVWQDASERGFVGRHLEDGRGILISITPLGPRASREVSASAVRHVRVESG
jgi:hypothetical protein